MDVFFGNEDHALIGTTRITRNIFAGTQGKAENAMLFLENLNKIKQAKNNHLLGKQSLLFRKIDSRDRDGMLSQASYPTQMDVADQGSQISGFGGRRFNSESDFESLDPVYED